MNRKLSYVTECYLYVRQCGDGHHSSQAKELLFSWTSQETFPGQNYHFPGQNKQVLSIINQDLCEKV
jgi:hypothetical protein